MHFTKQSFAPVLRLFPFSKKPCAAAGAVAALADEGSAVELYAGYGKNVVTALAILCLNF